MTRICVIFNPAARGEGARRFREHLDALSATCTLKPTQCAGGARALAAEAVREGFDTIVAAGGDGTINEVVNGIGDEPDGFACTRFGVLPLGTVNVFARELKLPLKFTSAWEVIQQGHETQIDLGQADFTENGRPERRYFVQMAGAGYDSRAIALASWELKKKFGALAYFIAGLRALRESLPEIRADTGESQITGQLVIVGNGRFYAGEFPFFPLADLQDGLLEVTLFKNVNVAALVRATSSLFCNSLYTWGGARHFQVEQLKLTSAEAVGFHVEGENAGMLPVRFSVRPRALRVLAPGNS